MKKINKYIISIIIYFYAVSLIGLPLLTLVHASSESNEFDNTYVLDDLQSASVGGVNFNVLNYPYVIGETKLYIVAFIEYCYSFKANMQGNYALYLYIYNPGAVDININSQSNKVQLATGYSSEGLPNDYTKFNLKFCSRSEGDYFNLFYKFKVVDTEKVILNRINSFFTGTSNYERRYDVSGFELFTQGATNPVEYKIGGTYKFTGYASGYGADSNDDSTLNCIIEELETVELDLKHTFYRTETSSKGPGYQNQLDTVYFAVPNSLFTKYGSLQRIKAEWYEYKTREIIVTSNNSMYNAMLPFIGHKITSQSLFNTDIPYGFLYGGFQQGDMWVYDWTYNGYFDLIHHGPSSYPSLKKSDNFHYLFYTSNISSYSPYADIVNIGGVESNLLSQWIRNYNASFLNGTLPIKDGNISADLFASDIDDYRKKETEYGKIQKGYSYYDFDADVDLQNFISYIDGNPSFWQKISDYGLLNVIFGNIPDEIGRTNIPPIYLLKDSDLSLSLSSEIISNNLLINYHDVLRLREFVSLSSLADKKVVLFRFATSDYFSDSLTIRNNSNGQHISNQTYMAWQSVYLDFDIIQLTFNKDGLYTVIPVVASPIDIINPVTPPFGFGSGCNDFDLQFLLAILLGLLLLMLLAPFLPAILAFLINLLLLPLRVVFGLFKTSNKRIRKKY